MKLSHRFPPASAVFDDPNLVSSAGLIPVVKLAQNAGLTGLADQHLSMPGDKGAHAGDKVMSLVAGMIAGGDSIDDMALLRHGAMGKIFDRPYAPSTLGSFLRAFTFGHVRQLDAVASRFLTALGCTPVVTGFGQRDLVDVDDTIIEVHGYSKQGSGYGYSGVRGLNAALATVTTPDAAPVIVAQRLRRARRAQRAEPNDWSPTLWPPWPACVAPTLRGHRWCGWTRRSTVARLCWPRSAPARMSRSPSAPTPPSERRSPPSARTPGLRSSTPTRSSTRPAAGGSPGPRSPRSRSPRSPRSPRPTRSPGDWSCAASPT